MAPSLLLPSSPSSSSPRQLQRSLISTGVSSSPPAGFPAALQSAADAAAAAVELPLSVRLPHLLPPQGGGRGWGRQARHPVETAVMALLTPGPPEPGLNWSSRGPEI